MPNQAVIPAVYGAWGNRFLVGFTRIPDCHVHRLHHAETGCGARHRRYQPLTLATTHRYPVVDYCLPGDPGHVINVSPVEPDRLAVMGLHS